MGLKKGMDWQLPSNVNENRNAHMVLSTKPTCGAVVRTYLLILARAFWVLGPFE